MTTLTLDPLASLLARLFDEADASSPATVSGLRQPVARRASAADAQQDRLHRLVCAPEGLSARGVARDRHAAVHARAQRRRAVGRRIRHVVRHFDAAPRGRAARQRRRPAGHERVRAVEGRAPGRTWRQPGWPISSRFARAMRCVRWPPICRIRSTCCCSTVRRRCIRRCLHSSSNGCGPARSSLPTMPISAPTISLTCARRRTAICRCRSATMSSCRCGSAELCGI